MKLLRRKFGEAPETIAAQVEAVASAEALDRLFDRALVRRALRNSM